MERKQKLSLLSTVLFWAAVVLQFLTRVYGQTITYALVLGALIMTVLTIIRFRYPGLLD